MTHDVCGIANFGSHNSTVKASFIHAAILCDARLGLGNTQFCKLGRNNWWFEKEGRQVRTACMRLRSVGLNPFEALLPRVGLPTPEDASLGAGMASGVACQGTACGTGVCSQLQQHETEQHYQSHVLAGMHYTCRHQPTPQAGCRLWHRQAPHMTGYSRQTCIEGKPCEEPTRQYALWHA
jgi:hypothetical protein